jgi:TRAP-type C4-dicarboxylate transport system permease small subunit
MVLKETSLLVTNAIPNLFNAHMHAILATLIYVLTVMLELLTAITSTQDSIQTLTPTTSALTISLTTLTNSSQIWLPAPTLTTTTVPKAKILLEMKHLSIKIIIWAHQMENIMLDSKMMETSAFTVELVGMLMTVFGQQIPGKREQDLIS